MILLRRLFLQNVLCELCILQGKAYNLGHISTLVGKFCDCLTSQVILSFQAFIENQWNIYNPRIPGCIGQVFDWQETIWLMPSNYTPDAQKNLWELVYHRNIREGTLHGRQSLWLYDIRVLTNFSGHLEYNLKAWVRHLLFGSLIHHQPHNIHHGSLP